VKVDLGGVTDDRRSRTDL